MSSAPKLHVIQFSTGLGSAEVARRVAAEHGVPNVHLLTADTLVEDDDNWRFAREAWDHIGRPQWHVLADGRTPMQAGPRHERPHRHEPHRMKAAEPLWAPWTVDAVLMRPPYVHKAALIDQWRGYGIEPPRLYAQGFSHANCGGACVRGGQAQWQLLLTVNRDRYLSWEAEEEETRDLLGKDVSILRDRTGGTVTPLTLRRFREDLERDESLFDADDWGACGCYSTDEVPA